MHKHLKNRTYIGKKLFFDFLGTDFVAPKSGQRREKHPVLWPDFRQYTRDMLNFNFSEKRLGLVSSQSFPYGLSRKMFLMLHSIN